MTCTPATFINIPGNKSAWPGLAWHGIDAPTTGIQMCYFEINSNAIKVEME